MSVSVAMCTYNGGNYLDDQLKSIVSQTLPPDEIIICDDGSTDNTIEIIQKFRDQTPIPISLYQNSTRLGITKNFQQAISLCKYDYIALSDQDDVWMKNKLQKQIEFLQQNQKEIDLVFSDLLIVNDQLESTGKTLWKTFRFTPRRQKLWRKGKAFLLQMKNGNVVAGSTLVFKAAYRKRFLDLLSRTYHMWFHDGIIAVVAGKEKKIDFIPEPLVKYRQHAQQATQPYRTRLYKDNIEKYEELYEDFSQMGYAGSDLCYLRNMISHLKFRAGLPHPLARRIIKVAGELFSLRYYRYSRSFGLTAFHDIVNKTNQLTTR
jgi:glycosyltransferase involved in cell wall biosynthesis